MVVEKKVEFCPHCNNTAPLRLIGSHNYIEEYYSYDDGVKMAEGAPCLYKFHSCETCGDVLLFHYLGGDQNNEELVFPNHYKLEAGVPDAVRNNYLEAIRIRVIAPHAYAVMIRRSLEAVCDDCGIKKGVLSKRLEELANKGDIPPTLAEMSDILRILGNIGAHNSTDKILVPMTWTIHEFFKAILEYVYIAPNKIKRFKNSQNRSKDKSGSTKEAEE